MIADDEPVQSSDGAHNTSQQTCSSFSCSTDAFGADEEDGGITSSTFSALSFENLHTSPSPPTPECAEPVDEEDFVLDRLAGRRKAKLRQPCSSTTAVDDVDDTVGGGSTVRRVCVYEYLCVWRGSDEQTWEPRDWIEELGYARVCDAFDEAHKPENQCKQPVQRAVARRGVEPGQVVHVLGGLRILVDMTRGAVAQARRRAVVRYAAVGSTKLERCFYSHWQAMDSSARPEFCYVPVDVAALHDIFANGIHENPKTLQESLSPPHDSYIWCCSYPEPPLERVPSTNLVLLCAALTSKSFLPGPNWSTFERVGGWFPMPSARTISSTACLKLVPLVLFEAKLVQSIEGIEKLRVREPEHVQRFEDMVTLVSQASR